MLCSGNFCGCGIVSASLAVTGSGALGDPYHIESNAFAVVTSGTRPSSPFVGQSILETDTDRYLHWDGTYWIIMAGAFPAVSLTQLTTDTTVTVPDITLTNAVYANEVYDSDGFHTGTTNVITIPTGLGGDYDFDLGSTWSGALTGYRLVQGIITSNATTVKEIDSVHAFASPPGQTTTNATTVVSENLRLEAGAVITIAYYQTSGGSLDVQRAWAKLRMTRHIPSLT